MASKLPDCLQPSRSVCSDSENMALLDRPDLSAPTIQSTHLQPPIPLTRVGPKEEQLAQTSVQDALDASAEDSSRNESPASLESQADEWPTTPKTPVSACWLSVFVDLLLGLVSVAYLIYGALVAIYNGAPVEEHPKLATALLNASDISPTIFPLLFAAVISRHLKAVMLRMLERGARLGDLDLMAGSNTVGSTIFTVFALRTVNMLAIALLIIWSLSPIGSQASLRVVTTRSSVESRPVSVKYLSLNQTYGAFEAGSKQSVEAVITGLFNSALLGHQQTRDSPRDLWDWVKVPMMEGLEHEPGPASNGGWHNIPQSRVQYSSLIGIPIIGLEEGSETVVNIESFYWDVDCPLLTPYEQPRDSFSYESGYKNGWWALESLTGNSRFATNRSEMMPAANPANYTPGTESCIDGAAITDELLDPREFSYHGFCGPTGSGDFGALCKMTTTYVEVELKCVGALCTASRIRRSNLEHPMPAWTILDTKCRWWGDFIRSLLATIEVKTSGLPTLIDGYLLDPDSHVSPLLDLPCTSVGNETFAFRLAQLLNAFWLITAAPWVIPYGLDGVPDGVYDGDVDLYSAVGLQSSTFEVIQCRFGWLVVLIFASTLLLAAAITSIVIRYMNVTPELSLNWSTMIRDNRYAKIPSTGSYLEDIERSRLLKSTNLMFGDVAAREDVGHLALSTTSGSRTVARVRPDRIFD